MKVKVSTSVKHVKFVYSAVNDGWNIDVNCRPIQEWKSSSMLYVNVGFRTIFFGSLKQAVKEAKSRGLIPKDFDAKLLQEEIEVDIIT
jgi:hypothetical protein